jgi:hypothetical protein
MRLLRTLPLLLTLITPAAWADQLYNVEMILFRQGSQPVMTSQPAPDDWAAGARTLNSQASTNPTLTDEAATLKASQNYQILLHQAWQQNVGGAPSTVAISSEDESFGHHKVEGTLSLKQVRFVDLDADFWVNQFDANGQLSGSERLKQSIRIKNNELTYLDHDSLGVLLRIKPL